LKNQTFQLHFEISLATIIAKTRMAQIKNPGKYFDEIFFGKLD